MPEHQKLQELDKERWMRGLPIAGCSGGSLRHSRIRSTSLNVISSFVRSYSLVVRGDSWPAICWACSSHPSFNFNGDDRRFVLCSLSDAAPKPRCHRELAACRGMLYLIRTFVL